MERLLRIYVETSVFGFAISEKPEHQDKHAYSVKLLDAIQAGKYEGYISNTTLAELSAAPDPDLRSKLLALANNPSLHRLDIGAETGALAAILIGKGIVPAAKGTDATHLAVMALYPYLDVLASWNYKHLVNVNVKRMLVPLLLSEGYRIGFEISSPEEVVRTDE